MKIFYIIILAALAQTLSAQTHESHDHSDEHRNEVGLANSPIYIIKEKEFAYGLHAHYIRSFRESKFGLGIGYERIFDEHKHNNLGVIFSYSPVDHLAVNISPGITFRGNDSSGIHFGLHLETLYEFELGMIHIGPVAEFSYAVDDYHLSLGVHIGFGF